MYLTTPKISLVLENKPLTSQSSSGWRCELQLPTKLEMYLLKGRPDHLKVDHLLATRAKTALLATWWKTMCRFNACRSPNRCQGASGLVKKPEVL